MVDLSANLPTLVLLMFADIEVQPWCLSQPLQLFQADCRVGTRRFRVAADRGWSNDCDHTTLLFGIAIANIRLGQLEVSISYYKGVYLEQLL